MFRVGDAVFDMFNGWGVVEKIANRNMFPVEVRFKKGKRTYKLNGCFSDHPIPTLSFTEYNLVTGGQSMERPPSAYAIKPIVDGK